MIDQCLSMLELLASESMPEKERFLQAHAIVRRMRIQLPDELGQQMVETVDEFEGMTDSEIAERSAEDRAAHVELLRLLAETQLSAAKDELITRLNLVPGKLPKEAMLAIRQHREVMIPILVDQLSRVAVHASKHLDADDPLPQSAFISLYMLAEFGASEALPSVLRILSLPGEQSLDLLGDAITEDTSRILAQLIPDSVEVLEPFIIDTSIHDIVRLEAIEVYLHFLSRGQLSREAVVQRLIEYLYRAIEKSDSGLATAAIYNLKVLAPREAIKVIETAYKLGVVRDDFVRYKDVVAATSWSSYQMEDALGFRLRGPITDAIQELSSWASFRESPKKPSVQETNRSGLGPTGNTDSRRGQALTTNPGRLQSAKTPGRNDPCSCGSGKKYKKCCALKST